MFKFTPDLQTIIRGLWIIQINEGKCKEHFSKILVIQISRSMVITKLHNIENVFHHNLSDHNSFSTSHSDFF